jgi:hypothetical protein
MSKLGADPNGIAKKDEAELNSAVARLMKPRKSD